MSALTVVGRAGPGEVGVQAVDDVEQEPRQNQQRTGEDHGHDPRGVDLHREELAGAAVGPPAANVPAYCSIDGPERLLAGLVPKANSKRLKLERAATL